MENRTVENKKIQTGKKEFEFPVLNVYMENEDIITTSILAAFNGDDDEFYEDGN